VRLRALRGGTPLLNLVGSGNRAGARISNPAASEKANRGTRGTSASPKRKIKRVGFYEVIHEIGKGRKNSGMS